MKFPLWGRINYSVNNIDIVIWDQIPLIEHHSAEQHIFWLQNNGDLISDIDIKADRFNYIFSSMRHAIMILKKKYKIKYVETEHIVTYQNDRVFKILEKI